MTTNSIADTLSSSLGLGYGINVSQLVSGLVSTTRAAKQAPIDTQVTTNNARISALASAKSSLTTFSSALTQLLKSSDYSGQPASSNDGIAAVSLQANATGNPVGLPATIEVKSLAAAQVLQSNVVTGGTTSTVAGNGTLTFNVGGTSYDVTLTSPANTLADLASAINDKKTGVTATVVTDSNGARLVLKGQTGAASTFSVTAGADADDNLKRFTYDSTAAANNMTRSQQAADAQVSIDNVDMSFSTNTITTAISNLRIDLNSASPGTVVTLATNQPTATMSQLVQDFVSTYNTMKNALNSSTLTSGSTAGILAGDSGVRDMVSRLSQLTSAQLSSTGPYRTLADIGVSTNRDGTLSVDTTRLTKVLSDNPDAVTQMLNPTTPTADSPGIGGALKTVTDYLNADSGPLATSTSTYDNLKTALQKQLDALDTTMTNYDDQLTATYTAMSTQLTALKAQQTYLTQQIDSWNNSSSK
ncbi:MAG TPA: flagellar filament capping protein FliD [Sphingobium sp.]|uniref:flagellar filament capping protein FliD n=1 Tax=Sphingobium sp. TaxID=1912891 RepID=UPI002ED1949A